MRFDLVQRLGAEVAFAAMRIAHDGHVLDHEQRRALAILQRDVADLRTALTTSRRRSWGVLSCTKDRDEDQFAGRAELGHGGGGRPDQGLAAHQILPLVRLTISLAFADLAGQDHTLDIEDGQTIGVHLVVSVQGHHILSATDKLPHSL